MLPVTRHLGGYLLPVRGVCATPASLRLFCYALRMTMRRLLGGVLVVLLVSGLSVAACEQQTTPQYETPMDDIAALRQQAEQGDADAQHV